MRGTEGFGPRAVLERCRARAALARDSCPFCSDNYPEPVARGCNADGLERFHYFKFSALPGAIFAIVIRSCPETHCRRRRGLRESAVLIRVT
jgi:hypothetical protein